MGSNVIPARLTAGEITSLSQYQQNGGGNGLYLARGMEASEVIRVLADAKLRGRGGAGFPTATKWDGIRSSPATRKFAVANGAEGEPGTFKDRYLIRRNPFAVI